MTFNQFHYVFLLLSLFLFYCSKIDRFRFIILIPIFGISAYTVTFHYALCFTHKGRDDRINENLFRDIILRDVFQLFSGMEMKKWKSFASFWDGWGVMSCQFEYSFPLISICSFPNLLIILPLFRRFKFSSNAVKKKTIRDLLSSNEIIETLKTERNFFDGLSGERRKSSFNLIFFSFKTFLFYLLDLLSCQECLLKFKLLRGKVFRFFG